ncbi:MAG: GH92 family glycosyl hydrolase [Actinobacteria bacterium]|nr:GH92 family glycosyl hydrolase [Actinomycetota bacterium]
MRRVPAILIATLVALFALGPARAAADLAENVDAFAGTEPGPATFGGGHNFPGASMPFGMLQWSPDTTPEAPHSGGYDYRDHHISGFGLTHLDGAGCSLYGDFPFMPTTEPLTRSPVNASGDGLLGMFEPGFSHSSETAHPGYYSVRLNPRHGGAIGVELAATTRTGIGRFTFPKNPHASVLVNAGGSAQPNDFAKVEVNPAAREISGTASSGLFCGQRPRYRVYFAAVFGRGFKSSGTWSRNGLEPGSTGAEASSQPTQDPAVSAQAGTYVTFDTRQNREVTVRVGISFVSVDGARANLAAESKGSLHVIASRARSSWDSALGRIRVSGGSSSRIGMFYTALYHALLAPRTFTDVGGRYLGMDGATHRAVGYTQYADFSGWDIYRTQIPLLAMLEPKRVSDMMRSLLADAEESGCLPRWPYAAGQSMTMVGDSADPVLAAAAAFGAKFSYQKALEAMLRGAQEECRSPNNGEYLERQGLAQYLQLGYLPLDQETGQRNSNSLYGSPAAIWGSAAMTLEYALDDFSIAQLAGRYADGPTAYAAYMSRSSNWRRLFNPETREIQPRYASGAFPNPYSNTEGGGFVEGDSAQYTWFVPQDPAGLFRAMGGRQAALQRLIQFTRRLNAGPDGTHTDHALLGNEPTLQTPWLFDWLGRPDLTSSTIRRALRLYSTTPAGYPGNDDLGTLSAWYVLASLGLYPEVPGTGVLALSTPAFRRAEVHLANHRVATITTKGPGIYVKGLKLGGRGWGKPWTSYCRLSEGVELAYTLQSKPNRKWGSSVADAPPSFGPHRPLPSSSCAF